MLSIYPSISSIFPVFCHGVTRFLLHYPYVTPVCLTLTQMHLPQSLQLHRIIGFACFFHGGFLSALLLHSGHTSKLQFFYCFSIVSRLLYAIMVPHRNLNFTWHHFTLPILSTVFPRVLINFPSVLSTQIFHCFPIFFHCFTSYSLIFSMFFSSFSPPLQSPQV